MRGIGRQRRVLLRADPVREVVCIERGKTHHGLDSAGLNVFQDGYAAAQAHMCQTGGKVATNLLLQLPIQCQSNAVTRHTAIGMEHAHGSLSGVYLYALSS